MLAAVNAQRAWEMWLGLGFDTAELVNEAPSVPELHRAAIDLFAGMPSGLNDAQAEARRSGDGEAANCDAGSVGSDRVKAPHSERQSGGAPLCGGSRGRMASGTLPTVRHTDLGFFVMALATTPWVLTVGFLLLHPYLWRE